MELKKYKLGEICDLNLSSLKSSDRMDDILYLDTSSITENAISGFQVVTRQSAPSRAQRKVKHNTIIFSTVRPNQNHFGIMRNPQNNLIVSSGFTTLDIKNPDEFDADYVYYKLTQPRTVNYLHTLAQNSVSAYPSINPDDIGNLMFEFPSLDHQRRIASVLSSLDSKISLNRRINSKLEALAKQLYDYWFVQFDFPNKEGKPYKSSGGKMVWNDVLKREIPEGWEVKRLGDVLGKLSSGKRPKGGIDKALKDGIPSLGAECIDDLGVFDYGSTPYLPFSYRDSITTGIIENKDILVYKDGAYVGKTTLFQDGFPFEFACVNEHVFLIHAKDENLQEYLLFTLKTPTYYEMMQKFGKAKAAQPGLNQDDICRISFLAPETTILKKFRELVEVPFHLIFSQSSEIATLTKQRDELLPLLMNGQVTIE